MSGIAWTEEQRAVLEEKSAELLVSAAAGSGKTAVLVERVVRAALGDGGLPPVQLDRLVAVTFTRAAAAELRAKVHAALAQRLLTRQAQGGAAGALREQLAALPRTQISTIHGLCAEILRRYGHTRGLPPARQLAGQEAALILHQLAGSLLDERLGREGDALREAALAWGGVEGAGPDDLSAGRGARGLREPLLGLHEFMRSLVDPQSWFRQHLDWPELDVEQLDPGHPLCVALEAELKCWVEQVTSADAQLAETVTQHSPRAAVLEVIRRRRAVLAQAGLRQGWEQTALALNALRQKQDDLPYKPDLLSCPRRDIAKEAPAYEALGAHTEDLRAGAGAWEDVFSAAWAEVAARENAARELLRVLWDAAAELDQRYAAYKRERGLQDFADLERGAFDVLRAGVDEGAVDAEGARPGVAALPPLPSEAALALRAQVELLLIDEHQDTSPLQDAILQLLTPDAPPGRGRPRLAVGDVKQSIYAFRLAAPELFRQARQRLDAQPPELGRALKLRGNFRSRKAIIDAVNYLFDGLMTETLGGEDYPGNQLEPRLDYSALYADRGAPAAADEPVRLHLLDTQVAEGDAPDGGTASDDDSNDGADDEESGTADEQQRYVARLLCAMHAAGAPVYDMQERRVRPVRWLDMAVLLRTAVGRVEGLKAALDEAGAPYYAPGRSGFYERPEVADALSLLRVVDNPRQDIALAAVLRGPAVQLDPLTLLDVARTQLAPEPPPLWERMQAYISGGADGALRDRLAGFVIRLAAWRSLARRAPLPELLWRIYLDTGLLIAAAAQRGGEQRLANLHHLLSQAQDFTQFHRQGLSRFLDFLAHSRRAAGDLGEAPLAAAGQDAVRVLTVHQAKGLEFPVVVVPDLHRKFNLQDLNSDVLWHRYAGAGGRYVDWRAETPGKHDTLSRRAVRQAKQADTVSEELRLLYVALTRARERLHLVAVADGKKRERLARGQPASAARCWLDWVGGKLAPAITAAAPANPLGTGGVTPVGRAAVPANPPGTGGVTPPSAAVFGQPVPAGPEGCWSVELRLPAATAQPTLTIDAAPVLTAQQRAQVVTALRWQYPHAQAARLPAKLTVTRLARLPDAQSGDGETLLSAQEYGGAQALEPPRPAFMRDTAPVTPTDIGEATHRLLARLDFARHTTPEAVAELRDELVRRGPLALAAAERIDTAAVARLARDLAPLTLAPGAQVFRELPLALLVPAAEVAGLMEPALASATEEQVYVQGVADLLIVTGNDALVLDYKTDHADADELLRRYTRQLKWYARAVAALEPGKRVRWALYGLAGAGLAEPHDSPLTDVS
jgi:ATP-dependent helicase/nuclease subunit A